MSERTEVSFDAALMIALRADAQKELDELSTPAQLKERYPDTSRWDARLQAALHKRRPMLKRVLVAALTLVILTLGALAVSADFRKTVYTMIQKFLPIEMQVTYKVEGEPLEQLPDAYSEHYVQVGFWRDYTQGYDKKETSVYKGYKRDKIEMRGDRAEISDFPLYLNTVAGGLDCRDQTIGGFSFVVKIYAVPVVEIIG